MRVKTKTNDELLSLLENAEFEERTEQSLELLKKQSCPCCGSFIYTNSNFPETGSISVKSVCRQPEAHKGHDVRSSFLPKGAIHLIALINGKEIKFFNNSGRNPGDLGYD